MSCGELGYYVRISKDHGDGNHEGSPLGDVLETGFISEGGSSDVRADGEEY